MSDMRAAVRAFHRLMRLITAQHEEASRLDAGFDGGEFSGPAHARMYEDDEDRIAALVAKRFGFEYDELNEAISYTDHLTYTRQCDAIESKA